jgi:tRNA threonylcarbamoyladenosine biosynthesis protein TsaB
MVKLLAIETSTEMCSVAVSLDGVMTEYCEHAPMRHAELLLPAVQSLLSDAGLALCDLDAIAFGRGPGSFTSLRIGIGVVQGLAWAGDVPVVPVSSLAAVAQAAVDGAAEPGTTICVALDARMDEVYYGNFEVDHNGLVRGIGAEQVCPPEYVEVEAIGPLVAAGNGFQRFDCLAGIGAGAQQCRADSWPGAGFVCRLALSWLQSNNALPPALAQPVYLRNNVAVKPAR